MRFSSGVVWSLVLSPVGGFVQSNMDVFKDDLFKNKYFIAVLTFLAIIIGITWLINYNSVESRCKRYVQGLGSMLGTGGNKLREMQIQSASEPLIQDCIKRDGL